jgi:hypothetical protein
MDNYEWMKKYYNGEITAQEYVSGILEANRVDTEPMEELLEQSARRIYILGVMVGAGIMGILWFILG